MKRFIFTSLLLFVGILSEAQEVDWGAFKWPEPGTCIGVAFINNEGVYCGLPYGEYRAAHPELDYSLEWYEEYGLSGDIHDDFLYSKDKRINRRYFRYGEKHRYMLIGRIVEMNEYGDTVMDFYFKEDGMIVASITGLKAKGKTWVKSIPIMITDMNGAMDEIGRKFCRIVKRAVRRKEI